MAIAVSPEKELWVGETQGKVEEETRWDWFMSGHPSRLASSAWINGGFAKA